MEPGLSETSENSVKRKFDFGEFFFHALTNYLKTLTIGYHRR
jgi:hypothetical protein